MASADAYVTAPDKTLFQLKSIDISYFSTETYVVGTH